MQEPEKVLALSGDWKRCLGVRRGITMDHSGAASETLWVERHNDGGVEGESYLATPGPGEWSSAGLRRGRR